MLGIKLRVGLLGLMAMLLVGSYVATAASAQGPFFHHRNKGETGNGVKWGQTSTPPWEAVEGKGPEAKLESKILAEPVHITAESFSVTGIIFNNALQGQTKIQFKYVNPKLLKPVLPCTVVIGMNNTVKLYGHLAWTWNGTAEQLKEQPQTGQKPDWIFLPSELQQGAETLPTELVFTQITLQNKGTEVCPLAGQFAVKGSAAAAVEPPNVGEWGVTEKVKALPNGTKQHFWNGAKNNGVEVNLKLGLEPAKLEQEAEVKTVGTQGFEPQEIAKFEN